MMSPVINKSFLFSLIKGFPSDIGGFHSWLRPPVYKKDPIQRDEVSWFHPISPAFHRPVSAAPVSAFGCIGPPGRTYFFQSCSSEMHFPFLSVSASTVRTRFSVFRKVLFSSSPVMKICPRAGSARDMVDTGPSGPVPILLLKVLRFLRIEFLYPFCQNLAKPVWSLSVCNLTSCKTGETQEKRCPGTAGSLPDPIPVRSVS